MAEQQQSFTAELVERMAALVRRAADDRRTVTQAQAIGAEARALVALFPEQDDPDLAEARELAEQFGWYGANLLPLLRSGGCDEAPVMRVLQAAIKRGRALASAQAAK